MKNKSFNSNRKSRFSLKIKSLFNLVRLVLSWLPVVFKSQGTVPVPLFEKLLNALENVSARGPKFFIDFIKDHRQQFLLYLSGEYPLKKVENVRVYHDGIPKIFGTPLANLLRRNTPIHCIRLLLTVLFASRALNLGKEPNIDSITSPSKIEDPLRIKEKYSKHIRDFWRDLGYRHRGSVPTSCRFRNYHLSTKTAPNGGNALYNSWTDFCNLQPEQIEDLKILGGPKFCKYLDNLSTVKDFLSQFFPFRGKVKRKISYFPDREMKVRVIAIGDYMSQTALKPLHHYLFKVLRKIPQDCTFHQGSFVEKITDWNIYYSIDLTAFTDRYPIWLNSNLLKGRFPDRFVEAWENTMVNHDFEYKDPKGNLHQIRYNVGNPMGFYSSWNSTSLAHHYLLYHCCRELNISYKDAKYCLLGDDIVIGDKLLAESYLKAISDLGVEFSPLKTHQSTKLIEFAKRYIYNGIEITPFPISALKETHKRFYLLVNLLREQIERGWIPNVGIPETVEKYYEMVKGRLTKNILNKKFLAKMLKRSHICNQVMKMTRGEITADEALREIVRVNFSSLAVYDFIVSDGSAEGMMSSLAVEAFADSQSKFTKGRGYPLGGLAEYLVMKITACEDFSIVGAAVDSIPAIPILHVYGRISEAYIEIQKGAFRIDTEGGGDWPFLLRSMVIPLDDRIFVERQSHLISRASSIIADKVLERCNLIKEIYGIQDTVKSVLDPDEINFEAEALLL